MSRQFARRKFIWLAQGRDHTLAHVIRTGMTTDHRMVLNASISAKEIYAGHNLKRFKYANGPFDTIELIFLNYGVNIIKRSTISAPKCGGARYF